MSPKLFIDNSLCELGMYFGRATCFSQCHVISRFSLSYSCLHVCLDHVKGYTDLQKYLNCFIEPLEGLELNCEFQRAFVMP